LARPTKSRKRIFVEYWLPVLLYVAAIATVSLQPSVRPPVSFHGVDKWLHLIEYAGLGFVLVRALRISMPRRDPLVAALVTLGIGMVLAVADEFLQSFVPGRDSSLHDVMADWAGLVVAMTLYMVFTRD
jgi:VanZ family protein